jgi:hypothetical protein
MYETEKKHPLCKAVAGLVFASLAAFGAHSCSKAEPPQLISGDFLISNSDASKESEGPYLLSTDLGHDGRTCPGCALENGKWEHKECMGYGHYCRAVAQVSINVSGTDITATTTDTFGLTNLAFFNMPPRSLSTGEGGSTAYLNIPAQLVERDTATLQFTFTGLVYSEKPWYNNN